ncbi:MAG: hypothetical protein GEU73_13520 [Chloroflexi bacterium]|nr:hypothetical protein [Chloroflexota bacterium]
MSVTAGKIRVRPFVTGLAVMLLLTSVASVSSVASAQDDPESSDAAVAVIRDYFRAISQRDYQRAYDHWDKGPNGLPSTGQTFEQFKQGFAETLKVAVKTGTPEHHRAAAAWMIPVTIEAYTTDGRTQHFRGTYTLTAHNVPEPLRWLIASADIAEVTPTPDPVTATPAPVALPATGGSPPSEHGGSGWPLGLMAALAVAGAAAVRILIARRHNP